MNDPVCCEPVLRAQTSSFLFIDWLDKSSVTADLKLKEEALGSAAQTNNRQSVL